MKTDRSTKRTNALHLLEDIQRSYSSLTTEDYLNQATILSDQYHSRHTNFQELHSLANAIIPASKYQNPYSYYSVYEATVEISDFLRTITDANQFDAIELPIIGTLPIPLFQARIRRSDEKSEDIILIGDGVFNYAFMVSHFFVQMLPAIQYSAGQISFKLDAENIKKEIDRKNLRESYAEFVHQCYHTDGFYFNGFPPEPETEVEMELTGLLGTAFTRFIISHECAHYLLGHTKDRCVTASEELCLTGNDISCDAVFFNWRDELSADILGSSIAVQSLMRKEGDSSFALVGIFLCLKAFEQFESAYQNMGYPAFSHTHPPYELRRKYVEKNCGADYNPDFFESLNRCFDMLFE